MVSLETGKLLVFQIATVKPQKKETQSFCFAYFKRDGKRKQSQKPSDYRNQAIPEPMIFELF